MKNIFAILVASVALGAVASASTVTCDAPPNGGVPVNVIGLTVTCGGLTFDNFNVVNAGGVGSPLVNLVSATFVNGVAYLNFNPNLLVSAGNVVDIQLFFTVTGGINQIDLGVGPSRASITEAVCTGSFAGGVCSGTPLADVTVRSTTVNQPIWSSPFPLTTPVYIFKDITVDGRNSDIFGPAADAGLSSFTQSFHTVPEPMTLSLMGVGLLGLGLMRRRQQSKK